MGSILRGTNLPLTYFIFLLSRFICSVKDNYCPLKLANTVKNCHPVVLKDLISHIVPRSSGKRQVLLGTEQTQMHTSKLLPTISLPRALLHRKSPPGGLQ